jgi:hypothetical protein
MTPKEKAEELVKSMAFSCRECDYIDKAKQCALIAVQEIINSNPHSNPFNTDIYSTMNYWIEVKQEIEKL